jgi:rubrerythrin
VIELRAAIWKQLNRVFTCRMFGHKRGQRVGGYGTAYVENGEQKVNPTTYRCPRCGYTWSRTMRHMAALPKREGK